MAPKDRPSEKIDIPVRPVAVKADFTGNGRKYVVIYNDGLPTRSQEIMPRGKGVPSQMPSVVYSMKYQSIETEPIPITIKMY
jgi:hypothetical protein